MVDVLRTMDEIANEAKSLGRIVKALAPIICGLRAGDGIGAANEWMESRDWEELAEAIKEYEANYGELQ